MPPYRSIVLFSGHRTDPKGRTPPRFPESITPQIQNLIVEQLKSLPTPILGISSAAIGGDVLFLKALMLLGQSATILLPYGSDQFHSTLLQNDCGNDLYPWSQWYHELLISPKIDRHILQAQKPNRMQKEISLAHYLNGQLVQLTDWMGYVYGVEPTMLTLYHQTEGDGLGGTRDCVEQYHNIIGGPLMVIDPTDYAESN